MFAIYRSDPRVALRNAAFISDGVIHSLETNEAAVESSIKHFMTARQDDVLQMILHKRVEEVEKREMIAICDRQPAASDWSIRSQNRVTGDRPRAKTPYKRPMRKLLGGTVGN